MVSNEILIQQLENKTQEIEEKILVIENRTKALQEAMAEWHTKLHTA